MKPGATANRWLFQSAGGYVEAWAVQRKINPFRTRSQGIGRAGMLYKERGRLIRALVYLQNGAERGAEDQALVL